MPNKDMNCKIGNKILKATTSAFNLYYEMSDGECWVKQTPEYWYTSRIAISLHKHFKKLKNQTYVILENSVSEIRNFSRTSKKGGPSKALRKNGRADISLWVNGHDDWWEPISIIEVKTRGDSESSFKADIKRICALLREAGKKETGTIENGYFVVITDIGNISDKKKSRKKLTTRYNKLSNKIREYTKTVTTQNITISSKYKLCDFKKREKSRAAIFLFKFELPN